MRKLLVPLVITSTLGAAALASANVAPEFTRPPTLRVHMPASSDPRDCGKGQVLLTLWTNQRLRTLEAKIGRRARYSKPSRLALNPGSRNGTLNNGYSFALDCRQIRQANLVVGRSYRIVARATNRAGTARLSTVVRLTRAR